MLRDCRKTCNCRKTFNSFLTIATMNSQASLLLKQNRRQMKTKSKASAILLKQKKKAAIASVAKQKSTYLKKKYKVEKQKFLEDITLMQR